MESALHSEFESKKQSIDEEATLSKGGSTRQIKLPISLFNNRDLLRWLKGLALDPYNVESSQYSTQRLQQEMLQFRKSIMLSDLKYPKIKRDLKQFLKDGKCTTPLGLSIEKSTNKNAMKKRRVQSSSISFSPYSKVRGHSFQGKQENNAFSVFIGREKCIFSQQHNCLLDSIESTKESNQVKQEHLVSGSDYTQRTKKSAQEKPNIELLQVLESLVILKDQMKTSYSSKTNKEDKEFKLARKVLLSRGSTNKSQEDFTLIRPVIPIGPRFQAEVPKWEGPTNKRHQHINNDLGF